MPESVSKELCQYLLNTGHLHKQSPLLQTNICSFHALTLLSNRRGEIIRGPTEPEQSDQAPMKMHVFKVQPIGSLVNRHSSHHNELNLILVSRWCYFCLPVITSYQIICQYYIFIDLISFLLNTRFSISSTKIKQ